MVAEAPGVRVPWFQLRGGRDDELLAPAAAAPGEEEPAVPERQDVSAQREELPTGPRDVGYRVQVQAEA